MPPSDLTDRYLARTQALATAGGLAVAKAWDELDTYEDADVARLERLAKPGVDVFASQAAATSAAYLSLLLDEPPFAATGLVDPDWRGPFTWFWRALGNGRPIEQSIEAGRNRALAAGQKAVVSTARRAGTVLDDRVTGWQRVTGGNACQWCITIAGQRYHTAESADFGHDHCSCGVTPILT